MNKGKYYEYKLVDYLEQNGYKTVRIPVSGTGKQPLPDVFATKNKEIYAFEVKARKGDIVYVDKFQIQKLFDFCSLFEGCKCYPMVAIYWIDKHEWKFYFISFINQVKISYYNGIRYG